MQVHTAQLHGRAAMRFRCTRARLPCNAPLRPCRLAVVGTPRLRHGVAAAADGNGNISNGTVVVGVSSAEALQRVPQPKINRTDIGSGDAAAVTASADSPQLSFSLSRIAKLRAERDRAFAELTSLESQLKVQLDVELNMMSALQSTEMDNFGYIRQFSGEPYDLHKAMGVPGGMLEMGAENFLREGAALLAALGVRAPKLLRGAVGAKPPPDTPEVTRNRELLSRLTLSNDAIWDREHAREAIKSPWVIKGPYYVLCWVLDVIFENRPIARFWLLETVARMPYFSYINMLHLYESLGWWRRSMEARKVHFAEEWNEAHHLLIMESLGGDQRWSDRFIAQHAAVVYYAVLLLLWVVSPTLAYNFSELIEAHAVDTYAQFVDENEAILKQLPPPRVARLYYESDDKYLFDTFQTERLPGSRFVTPGSLYDVFANIRDDEAEHVATMHAMQRQDILDRAPNIEALILSLITLSTGLTMWRTYTADAIDVVEVEGTLDLLGALEASLNFLAELVGFL